MLCMMNIGGDSAIEVNFIALTFVDLERDSAVFEQVHTALTAYSVRLARCLRFIMLRTMSIVSASESPDEECPSPL